MKRLLGVGIVLKLVAVCVLSTAPLDESVSRGRIAISLEAANAWYSHSSSELLRIPGQQDSPGTFGEQQSSGLSAGAGIELRLGASTASVAALALAVSYLDAGVSFVAGRFDTEELRNLDNGTAISPVTQYVADVDFRQISAELLMHMYLPRIGLRIFAGPAIAFPISSEIQEYFALLEPRDASFPPPAEPQTEFQYSEDNRRITFPSRSIPAAASPLVFAKAGLLYEFTLRPLVAAPFVSTSLALNSLSDTGSWSLWVIRTGLRLSYEL